MAFVRRTQMKIFFQQVTRLPLIKTQQKLNSPLFVRTLDERF